MLPKKVFKSSLQVSFSVFQWRHFLVSCRQHSTFLQQRTENRCDVDNLQKAVGIIRQSSISRLKSSGLGHDLCKFIQINSRIEEILWSSFANGERKLTKNRLIV